MDFLAKRKSVCEGAWCSYHVGKVERDVVGNDRQGHVPGLSLARLTRLAIFDERVAGREQVLGCGQVGAAELDVLGVRRGREVRSGGEEDGRLDDCHQFDI